MKRFKLLSVLLAFSVSFNLFAADQPNILLFLVDDMGVMDTSQPMLADDDGQPVKHPLNDFYRTPAMESLAKNGLCFSQFYANSVCSPTRASIMTGQTSARHKTTQWISPGRRNTGGSGPKNWNWHGLKKTSVTLPRILQAAGYRTIHSGKAHFGPKKSEGANPENLGFDINIAGCSYGSPGSYFGKENFGAGGKRSKRAIPGLEQYHGKDIFLTEALTVEINKSITTAVKEDKPFFAYMSHYAVHSPFQSDPRFEKNYESSDKNDDAKKYATMIEGMDKSLTDIMANIEKLGVAENTLVIFLGDNGSDGPLGSAHGYSSSAPLRGKKGTSYEGGMRVPFIASWAKPSEKSKIQKKFPIKQGLLHDEFSSVCDLLPTILEVTDTKAAGDHKIDGNSLWDYFAGKKNVNPQKFLMHFPHNHRSSYFTAYREKEWKLIYNWTRPQEKRYELFNLTTDPIEKNNLAETEPKMLKSMLAAMKRELDAASAQYPVEGKSQTPLKFE